MMRELHGENYTDMERITQREIHRKTHGGKYLENWTKRWHLKSEIHRRIERKKKRWKEKKEIEEKTKGER